MQDGLSPAQRLHNGVILNDCPVVLVDESAASKIVLESQKQQIGRAMSTLRLTAFLALLLGLIVSIPLTDAFAQSAVGGAIIGGALGGRRGAAIGAVTGAAVGAHRRYWHGHHGHWRGNSFYYWHRGSCWVRSTSGRSHAVSHRYCR